MSEASSSRLTAARPSVLEPEHVPSPTDEGAISLHLPTSFLVLPPTAALIGLGIGMSRGGSRARLRFLAENAHRPPTTYRGWASQVPLHLVKSRLTKNSISTQRHVITESYLVHFGPEGNML